MTYNSQPARLLRPLLCLALLLTVGAQAFAQGPTPTEQRIAAYVDHYLEDAIDLLERTTNINSGTMNFEGVRAVGRVFQAGLDSLGFLSHLVDQTGVDRAGHLVAFRAGGSSKTVLLIGHLDTVFEQDSPFQEFHRLGSHATGPGTEDMKGGDVVIVYALKALQAAGVLDSLNIYVVMTGDEEDPGEPVDSARVHLVAAARQSNYALGFEAGIGTGTATIARRGFTGWTLKVKGTPWHSSQIFRGPVGSGSIYEAARILHRFHEELGEEYLTFNPGMIVGGTTITYDLMQSRGTAFGKTNVVAESTLVAGDLRFISNEQRERAKERMRGIVSRHLPRTSAEITFQDSYPAMAPNDGNLALLAKLDRVSRDLSYGPVEAVDPSRRGAADVAFASSLVQGSLDGLGIVGEGGHTVDESVDLSSLSTMIKRAAILIYRLAREGEDGE